MLLRRWCPKTLRDVLEFDMPIICDAEEGEYLRWSLRLVRNVETTSEYRRLDLCCFEDPLEGLYSVKDADTNW